MSGEHLRCQRQSYARRFASFFSVGVFYFFVWIVFVVLMFVAVCVRAGNGAALGQVVQGDQAEGQEAPGVGRDP